MFTIISNPFAEMTQGLSGQPQIEQVHTEQVNTERFHTVVPKPFIKQDYNDHYEYKESSSSGWWTVFFIFLLLLSGIGLFLWFYSNYEKEKEEESKKLEEEQKRLAENQKEIIS